MPPTRPGAAPRPRLVRRLVTAALLVGALLPVDPAAAAAGPRPAFGAVTADLPALGALERAVGRPVASYTFYRAWQSTPDFPAALAGQVAGAVRFRLSPGSRGHRRQGCSSRRTASGGSPTAPSTPTSTGGRRASARTAHLSSCASGTR